MANRRVVEVAVTREFSGATPVWTNATIHTIPEGSSTFSIDALGATDYAVRTRVQDVFGNYSAWSDATTHTTTAGSDSLVSSLLDHDITETEIADDSISTPKLQANSVTAQKLVVGLANYSGNLVKNGSFEEGHSSILINSGTVEVTTVTDNALLGGWLVVTDTRVRYDGDNANVKQGTRVGTFVMDSTDTVQRFLQDIPVIAGRTYRLTGWHWKTASGGVACQLRANTLDEVGSVVSFAVILSTTTGTTPVFCDGTYTVPTDGSVSYLRVECIGNGTPAGGDEEFNYEDIALQEVANRVANTAATVVIDENGITITDGALTLADVYGESVLDAYGFGGTWLDYFVDGFRNSSFGAGSTSDIAVSEVGDGDTLAEYQASLSANLPEWVVAQSGGTLALESDSTATRGFNLKSSGASAQENRWYQDVPVGPYMNPAIWMNYRLDTPGASSADLDLIVSWRDENHALVGTEETMNLLSASTADHGAAWQNISAWVNSALSDSADQVRFIRVEFMVTHNTATTSTLRVNTVRISLGESAMGRTEVLGALTAYNGLTLTGTLSQDGSILLIDSTDSVSFIGSTYTAAITSEATGANLVLDARNIHFNGRMRLNSVISPAALTGNTDNWAPTGYETANWIRAQSDATPRNLTGIVAPAATGSMLWLSNINTAAVTITLVHDATSTAANRFICPGYANYALTRGTTVLLVYDNSVARWRVMGGL